ncbi:Pectinesterase/pectinesterase inhibitor PPE8B [Spatholobus suberectus]|nr:Pectinesterase/pectinesterase inhibitor PPE8B [Spatholobus suberectus]
MAVPSVKQPRATPTLTLTFTFSLVLFLALCTPLAARTDFAGSACLKVSPTQFGGSVTEVIGIIQQVASILSRFTSRFADFRLATAVADCLDLLDLSSDVLSWSLSATQNPKGIKLTHSLLAQVLPVQDQFATTSKKGQFPSWVRPNDRKLLQASGVVPDAVVAADGSGNYATIVDAVLAAPDYSMKRFVIYVKKGVYIENVEIKKKKWNIMMVGDGMDATIISGNRSFVDGWTTFRSPTFGMYATTHTDANLFSSFLFFL